MLFDWFRVWIELPERYGRQAYSELAKGASHKYMKRVPSGRVTKTGRPVYRYFYAVHRGGGIDHEQHFVEGAGFRHGPGHYHIRSVDGDILTIEHDETGHRQTITKAELSRLLRGEHMVALDAHAEKLRGMYAEAMHNGASPKQLARIRQMAHRRNVSLPERPAEEKADGSTRSKDGRSRLRSPDSGAAGRSGRDDGPSEFASETDAESVAVSEYLGPTEATASPYLSDPVGRQAWVPVPSPAQTLHEDLAPVPTEKLREDIKVFPNPNVKKGITQLFPHQVDGAERALTAFKTGDGIVISDDAGLGKTNTGMATLIALGGKRNVIIVPTAGKAGISRQWDDTAKLYGHTVTRGLPEHEGQEGTFIVAYDEIVHMIKPDSLSPDVMAAMSPKLAMKMKNQKPKFAGLHPMMRGHWDAVVFDESHTMANHESIRAKAAMELQDATTKAVYLSATPFTKIADMHYLTKLGMFKNRKEFLQWAKVAGATVSGDEVKNPSSPLPMAAIAATLHVDGKLLKRVANLKGMESRFDVMDSTTAAHPARNADAKETFDGASEIFNEAVSSGILPESMVQAFRSSWARQYWETLKVPAAIEAGKQALAEGKQVAFFTSFKSADHAHLRALADIAFRRAANLPEHKMSEAMRLEAVGNKILSIVEGMPEVTPAISQLVAAFGGPDTVAEIHGNTRKKPEEEQAAYQSGAKKVVVATMARGGTGISLHDDQGLAPRVQINTSLPWSGREFNQVAGRSHRLGSKSGTVMRWLVGDDETEKKNASIVAGRLKSMGSLTVGDPDTTAEARQLANWEFGETMPDATAEELADAAMSAVDDVDATDEAAAARDYFREYAEARKAGRDVLGEEYKRRRAEREKRAHAAARKALLQLDTRFPGFASATRFSARTDDELGAYGVSTHLKRQLERAGIKAKGKVGQRWYIDPESLPQLAKDAGVHRVEVDSEKLRAMLTSHAKSAPFSADAIEARAEMAPAVGNAGPLKVSEYAESWIRAFDGDTARMAQLTSKKLSDQGLTRGQRAFWSDINAYLDHVKAGGAPIHGSSVRAMAETHSSAASEAATSAHGATAISHPALSRSGLKVSPYGSGVVLITGNTYSHSSAIKSVGGKWDGGAKGWRLPLGSIGKLAAKLS